MAVIVLKIDLTEGDTKNPAKPLVRPRMEARSGHLAGERAFSWPRCPLYLASASYGCPPLDRHKATDIS